MDREQKECFTDLEQRLSAAGNFRAIFRSAALKFRWNLLQTLFSIIKRLIDVFVAVLMALILVPIVATIAFSQGMSRRIFANLDKIGQWGEPYQELYFFPENQRLQRFIVNLGLTKLPVAINILRGDLSLIGPRALSPEEFEKLSPLERRRLDVKPGILCLWWIRLRGNIGYEGEMANDIEYVNTHAIKKDFGIALKAFPAYLFGANKLEFKENLEILNIPIQNLTMSEAIAKMVELAQTETKKQICFVNADCANIAWKNPDYIRLLMQSEMNLADGIGLKLAGKIIDQEIRQNVNGTDLFPRLMKALEKNNLSVYFLGAKPEVNATMIEKLKVDFPALKVLGGQHGYYSKEEEASVLDKIKNLRPDIIFVAFGAPKQDLWIAEHLNQLPVKVAMGVGGLFDFYSGRIERAPVWMREIGLEWLFRFIQEPKRMWKRYFVGNFLFIYRVIRSKSGLTAPSLSMKNSEKIGKEKT